MNIIQPGTPDEVMINILKRLDTGGLPLIGQEIRNALYKGQARNFLAELVKTEQFQKTTDGRIRDDRMDAEECDLRFAAFYLDDRRNYDRNDLDSFLSEAMRKLNALDASSLERVREPFLVAIVPITPSSTMKHSASAMIFMILASR